MSSTGNCRDVVHEDEYNLNEPHYISCARESCLLCLLGVGSCHEIVLPPMEDAAMQRTKQASKKKRMTKAAVPALGVAGLTFSLAGSAAASAVPPGDLQQRPNFAPGQFTTLSEEELADVSLATFHLANQESRLSGVLLARGCGGCRGCGGGRGRAARGWGGWRGWARLRARRVRRRFGRGRWVGPL